MRPPIYWRTVMGIKIIPIPDTVYDAFKAWQENPPTTKTWKSVSELYAQSAKSILIQQYFDSASPLYEYLKNTPASGVWIDSIPTEADSVTLGTKVQKWLSTKNPTTWHSLGSESARLELVKKIVKARLKNPGMQVTVPLEYCPGYTAGGDPKPPVFTILVVPVDLE